ncbi:MAG: penicillin acylase family protein [Gammaproteobacteria bacterium]|nr:MAG: penicillin acylase family protein [Gammaproteobacteria bacterium]
MNRSRFFISALILLVMPFTAVAGIMLPGLEAPVKVVRDANGVPHIHARNEHDLFFMQGRIHAEDRLFQMDLLRRTAAGTLAELVGPSALPNDIEARTIGLGRAAERSLAEHSPPMLEILQAYSDGVNSFLDETGANLPPEYLALQLTEVEPWQPLDSVLVGKALGAATSLIVADDIDLTIALQAYQFALGEAAGAALFFEDLYRSAPFDPASTVPDALNGFMPARDKAPWAEKLEKFRSIAKERSLKDGRDYVRRIRKLPRIPGVLRFDGDDMGGSNTWVVSGKHTPSRRPLLANDMHLRLESPPIFHEIGLMSPSLQAAGSNLPGVPCVVRGHNQAIAWGITNARMDITDVYAEAVIEYPASPSGYATLHQDANGIPVPEPIGLEIETFRANIGGVVEPVMVPLPDGPSPFLPVLIVPRRNHGPLITPPNADTPLSVQSVGFGPTRDLEGFCAVNRAHNLDEFKAALQLIDFGSQNVSYADKAGNIAYFVTGEVPLREDLQNLAPTIPPFLIRNGFVGNEWIPLDSRPDNQATAFEILPFDEMPQVVNPPSGVIVNANNDQAGNTLDNNPLNDLRADANGLYYLNWGGRNFSIRAGRATEMINELLSGDGKHQWRARKISFKQLKKMQADTVLNDARALMPYILDAWDNASQGGANPALASFAGDPGLQEAVERLRQWDFTTPTGIPEGYDADPGTNAIEASVATTIYSVWRGKMVANSIDATLDGAGLGAIPRPSSREEVVTALQHLLKLDGVGISGVNFFNVPGVADPATRRHILVLKSLADALEMLASNAFAAAFHNSTNQQDYRWGRLHRIVFKNPLGDAVPFLNVPPAAGRFEPPLSDLPGIPTDGGFETIDEAPPFDANNVRVSDSNSFMFEYGPTGRFVARTGPWKVKAVTSLPGGNSAVPSSPYYVNLLEPYLINETFKMRLSSHHVDRDALSVQSYLPGSP